MKRLVDTKFTKEQEKFINLAEGEVWTEKYTHIEVLGKINI